MSKMPRIGREWSRLWDVVGDLASQIDFERQPSDAVTLTQADARWLCELLSALGTGVDVSSRFFMSARAGTKNELHFWIACDLAQHVHDERKPARTLVAERWGIDAADREQNVARIARQQRGHVAQVRRLLGPAFARIIESQRQRLLAGNAARVVTEFRRTPQSA
jgi:hypothetical protein